MKILILIIVLFLTSDIYALDTAEDILLRIETQNLLTYEKLSELYRLQFSFMLMIILSLGFIAGGQR